MWERQGKVVGRGVRGSSKGGKVLYRLAWWWRRGDDERHERGVGRGVRGRSKRRGGARSPCGYRGDWKRGDEARRGVGRGVRHSSKVREGARPPGSDTEGIESREGIGGGKTEECGGGGRAEVR